MDSSHHILHINPSLQVHIPLHVDLGFALGFCWEHLDILTLDMACYQLAQPTPAVPTSSLVEKTFESQSRKTTKSQKVPENAVEFSECYKKNKEKRNEDHSHVSHVCIIYIYISSYADSWPKLGLVSHTATAFSARQAAAASSEGPPINIRTGEIFHWNLRTLSATLSEKLDLLYF